MLAQEDRVAMVLDLKREVGIDPVAEFDEHFERLAQRRLVDDQQADHAEVRDRRRSAAILSPKVMQPEASALSSRSRTAERAGMHLFGIAQHGTGQAGLAQQRRDVEAELFGDGEIAGQRGGANELHPCPLPVTTSAENVVIAVMASGLSLIFRRGNYNPESPRGKSCSIL